MNFLQKRIDEHRKVCYHIIKLREGSSQDRKQKDRRTKTMTTLQKRRLKKKLRRFWKEWGMTLEEFEMLLGAMSTIMFPFLLRIILAFFGI